MSQGEGFDGCMYGAQWNNLFPLRMVFEDPKNPNVYMEPSGILKKKKTCLVIGCYGRFCAHFRFCDGKQMRF